jgi:hypothetical protein
MNDSCLYLSAQPDFFFFFFHFAQHFFLSFFIVKIGRFEASLFVLERAVASEVKNLAHIDKMLCVIFRRGPAFYDALMPGGLVSTGTSCSQCNLDEEILFHCVSLASHMSVGHWVTGRVERVGQGGHGLNSGRACSYIEPTFYTF